MVEEQGLAGAKLKLHDNETTKSCSIGAVENLIQKEAARDYYHTHRELNFSRTDIGEESIEDVHDSLRTVRTHYEPGESLGLHRVHEVPGVDPMHHFLVAGRDDPQPLLAKQCLEESGVGHGIMEDSRKRSLATAEIYDEYKNRLKKGRKLEKATEGRVTKAPRIRKKESEADKRYHDEAEQAQKPQEEGYEEQGSCWKGQNI